MNITIRGLQEAQRHNLKMVRSFEPNNALEDVVRDGTVQAHRYAVAITHVWRFMGGALRAAHRMAWAGFAKWQIYIDPVAISPRGQKPSVYGPFEHARGGEHAFYERVENERGRDIGEAMGRRLARWWG